MRLPAFEKLGEQALEVAVHFFEGVAQAFASLAVEVADRSAQAIDRFCQLFLLGGAGAVFLFDPFQFFGRHEVHRPDAFAAGGEAVHLLRLLLRAANGVFVEFEASGKHGRRALKTFARNPRHFDPPCILAFGARRQRGTVFARFGQRLVRAGEIPLGRLRRFLCFRQGGFRLGQFFAETFAHRIALFDFTHQALRLRCSDRAVCVDFFQPQGHVGQATGRIARAGFPPGNVRAVGSGAFPRHGKRLIMRCKPGIGGLQRCPGGFVSGLRRVEARAAGRGIGQLGMLGLCRGELVTRRLEQLRLFVLAPGDFFLPICNAFAFRLRPVECAQGIAFLLRGFGGFAVGDHDGLLRVGQLIGNCRQFLFCLLRRCPQIGKAFGQFGKPVFRFQPGGFGGAFTARNESVPAAQCTGLRHQPFPCAQGPPVVGFADMHHGQSGTQFVGTRIDMIGQRIGHAVRRFAPGPVPAFLVRSR